MVLMMVIGDAQSSLGTTSLRGYPRHLVIYPRHLVVGQSCVLLLNFADIL